MSRFAQQPKPAATVGCHTPGPWTVGDELNSERPGSIPIVAVSRDSLDGRMHVAFVNGKAGEQESNARLISLAPALLRLVEGLLPLAQAGVGAYLDAHSNPAERSGHLDGLMALIEDAGDAIAVARGL